MDVRAASRDPLFGGPGDDKVFGQDGRDRSGGGFAGNGPRVVGGPGEDVLSGGSSGEALVSLGFLAARTQRLELAVSGPSFVGSYATAR